MVGWVSFCQLEGVMVKQNNRENVELSGGPRGNRTHDQPLKRLVRCAFLGLILLGAAIGAAEAQTCTTPQPGPSWVCVGGGWLPPGHPGIPPVTTPTPAPAPPPTVAAPAKTFTVGKRYQRQTTDIRILGVVQLESGFPAFVAECLAEGDGCFFVGYLRPIVTNASAADWVEVRE